MFHVGILRTTTVWPEHAFCFQPHRCCWQPTTWLLVANHIVVGSQPHGCWQPTTLLLAANHVVVGGQVAGSQSHGCWQPITWFVGSQPHSCWQPKAWLLAANRSQKHGCWQPKTWLLAANHMVVGSSESCWHSTKKGIVLFKKNGV